MQAGEGSSHLLNSNALLPYHFSEAVPSLRFASGDALVVTRRRLAWHSVWGPHEPVRPASSRTPSMQIFFNALHRQHDGRQEMFRGRLVPCHERPDRLEFIVDELRRRGRWTLVEPGELDAALVRRVHAPRYVDFLQSAWDEWVALDPENAELDILPSVCPVRGMRADVLPSNFSARVGLFSFDSGSPLTSGTWAAAAHGAACAIDAARAVSRPGGDCAAMALTRPPGHHAGVDYYGGYCFLNNAALAGAGAARRRREARRGARHRLPPRQWNAEHLLRALGRLHRLGPRRPTY
jgi:hypothetical protein